MRHPGTKSKAAILATILALGVGPAVAQQAPAAAAPAAPELTAVYRTSVMPVFTGNTTIIGQTIAFPTGSPLITNAIVTIPPGGETGWHTHSVPLFAYVLEGTVTIDYGSKGLHTLSAGSSFLEAMDWPHNAHNYGDMPVRILAVYLGAEGTPNAETAPGPE